MARSRSQLAGEPIHYSPSAFDEGIGIKNSVKLSALSSSLVALDGTSSTIIGGGARGTLGLPGKILNSKKNGGVAGHQRYSSQDNKMIGVPVATSASPDYTRNLREVLLSYKKPK